MKLPDPVLPSARALGPARGALRLLFVSPALDEEDSVGGVVRAFLDEAGRLGHAARFVVADNGSSDDTAARAAEAGAVVVSEARRGYGAACLRALREASDEDAVVFVDADGACDPADLRSLLSALDHADLVIGSRVVGRQLGLVDDDALTAGQRAGSFVAGVALQLVYGHHATDLGPFRVIRAQALRDLALDDQDFGWTVQMQARACRTGLRVVEVPVTWRRRHSGRSKVSGDIKASIQAGRIILTTLARELLRG